MTISGQTIDYGPCAFMDHYDAKTVFSSIDKFGRYSFSNQPKITKWNLARFAECLIPLIDQNEDSAIKKASDVVDNFEKIYEKKWLNMMRDKLGLFGEDKEDKKLINDLLNWMELNKVDYTNTFCYLMNVKTPEINCYKTNEFNHWMDRWKKRLNLKEISSSKYLDLMRSSNPIVIPRNHKVEEALNAANENNLELLKNLLTVLENPYADQKNILDYQSPLPITEKKFQTFCGT